MAHMIILIQPSQKRWTIQIGNQEKYETFNLAFNDTDQWAIIDGFSIPCLSAYPIFDIYGDHYSRTIAYATKVLPKIKDASDDVPQFLTLLAKKFKIDSYQINVNSDFACNGLAPWSVSAVVAITNDLRRIGFSLDF